MDTISVELRKETFEKLKEFAVPLVDSISDVIDRLIDANRQAPTPPAQPSLARSPRRRNRQLVITPQNSFKEPVLRALHRLGGAASARDVLDLVQAEMASQLLPDDYTPVSSSNEHRWRNNARWAKKKLVFDGLIERNTLKGWWQLTDLGRKRASQL